MSFSDSGAPDYKRAKEVVQKFSRIVADNHLLKELFTDDGVYWWPLYSQNLFRDTTAKLSGSDVGDLLRHTGLLHALRIVALSLITLLYSLVSLLIARIRNITIAVFTTNRVSQGRSWDFRLDPLYSALGEKNTPIIEIIHAIPSLDSLHVMMKRGRLWVHLEALDIFCTPFVKRRMRDAQAALNTVNTGGLSDLEKALFSDVVRKYAGSVSISKTRVKMLSLGFLSLSVKKLFLIDDVRHWSETLIAAKRAGIRTYAIQHGHFTKYHIGWLNLAGGQTVRPDKLFVWSDYWKNELLRLGTYLKPEELLIAGAPRASIMRNRTNKDVSVLIPYEAEAPKKAVASAIHALMKEGVNVVFKTRPDVPEEQQLKEYGLWPVPEALSVAGAVDPEKVAAVLGTYSTLLYDLVGEGYPVAILSTDFDYGEGMVENRLAASVRPESIVRDVRALTDTDQSILSERRERLLGTNPRMLKETILDIIDRHD